MPHCGLVPVQLVPNERSGAFMFTYERSLVGLTRTGIFVITYPFGNLTCNHTHTQTLFIRNCRMLSHMYVYSFAQVTSIPRQCRGWQTYKPQFPFKAPQLLSPALAAGPILTCSRSGGLQWTARYTCRGTGLILEHKGVSIE